MADARRLRPTTHHRMHRTDVGGTARCRRQVARQTSRVVLVKLMMLFYMKEVLARQVKHSPIARMSRRDQDACMRAFDDGRYDVFIIDANDDEDGATRIELTVTTGARKGEVIALTARNIAADAVSLMGLPATLMVEHGTPRLVLDG
jgi:hypothetical protein